MKANESAKVEKSSLELPLFHCWVIKAIKDDYECNYDYSALLHHTYVEREEKKGQVLFLSKKQMGSWEKSRWKARWTFLVATQETLLSDFSDALYKVRRAVIEKQTHDRISRQELCMANNILKTLYQNRNDWMYSFLYQLIFSIP